MRGWSEATYNGRVVLARLNSVPSEDGELIEVQEPWGIPFFVPLEAVEFCEISEDEE